MVVRTAAESSGDELPFPYGKPGRNWVEFVGLHHMDIMGCVDLWGWVPAL